MPRQPRSRQDALSLVPCPNCKGTADVEMRESVSLEKMERADGATWSTEGDIQILQCVHGHCSNCGMIFETVRRVLPVQYASLACPSCRRSDRMVCEPESIERRGGSYRFSATIRCRYCQWLTGFVKGMRSLWQVTRIKIGVTGIEVERAAPKAG